jgi:LPS sulfotransferase NodH
MTNVDTIPNIIFVGGAPRSGTTLLQNMLDSHPDISGGPEFLHLPDIIRLRKSMQHSLRKGWLEEYCTNDIADKHLKQLICNFLLPISKNKDTSFISEKTPANIIVFSDLAELFPDAFFLQILRDPRAVVASMLKVGRRGKKNGMQTQPFTRNIVDAVNYLRTCYAKGTAFQTGNGRKLLTLKYEALVTQPEDVTRQICTFLDLPWDERMLRPDKQKHVGEKAITNEVWYNEKEYRRRPTDTEIEKWRGNLSFAQKAILFYCFRKNQSLSRNGYRLDQEFKTLAARQVVSGLGRIFYLFLKIERKIIDRILKPVMRRLS